MVGSKPGREYFRIEGGRLGLEILGVPFGSITNASVWKDIAGRGTGQRGVIWRSAWAPRWFRFRFWEEMRQDETR